MRELEYIREKRIPDGGTCQDKNPEAEACLVCSRNTKKSLWPEQPGEGAGSGGVIKRKVGADQVRPERHLNY